jgi:hypothetical protein
MSTRFLWQYKFQSTNPSSHMQVPDDVLAGTNVQSAAAAKAAATELVGSQLETDASAAGALHS